MRCYISREAQAAVMAHLGFVGMAYGIWHGTWGRAFAFRALAAPQPAAFSSQGRGARSGSGVCRVYIPSARRAERRAAVVGGLWVLFSEIRNRPCILHSVFCVFLFCLSIAGRFLIRLSDSLFSAPQSDLEKNQNAVRKGLARNAQIRGVFGSPP
jgi:hypothetical protein